MGNDFNFHVHAFWKRGDLNGRTRRKIAGEMFRVNFVHAAKSARLVIKHRAFDNIGEGQFLVVENGLDILEHAFGLRLDVSGDRIPVAGSMGFARRKRANRQSARPDYKGRLRGRFRGFDDGFLWHGLQHKVYRLWR